jgi:HSP20 family protein
MAENAQEMKTQTYAANCDIFEEDGKVILSMEMPGIEKGGLDIKIDGDHLLIHGKIEAGEQQGRYLVREIRRGDYYNDFSLDETIDRNKIDASVKNGIVTITLGIRETARPRKINVVTK